MKSKKVKRNQAIRRLSTKQASSELKALAHKYPAPPGLLAVISQPDYYLLLRTKATDLLVIDRKLNRPCARGADRILYVQKINEAVWKNWATDPFTGESIRWNLVGRYDPERARKDKDYFKRFYLLPSVDHIDPDSDILEFEICSWLVNLCKGNQTPVEYIALCDKIVSYRVNSVAASPLCVALPGAPAKYFLPPFLVGICSLAKYRKWLYRKAYHLFARDQRLNRACVVGQSIASYEMAIHMAILASGPCDPYTGQAMDWTLIGMWNDAQAKQGGEAFRKKFALMPTIDHTDPYATDLAFEICSLLVNECKNNLNADEFIGLCKKVVAFRGNAAL
jgi:hypothetical protein